MNDIAKHFNLQFVYTLKNHFLAINGKVEINYNSSTPYHFFPQSIIWSVIRLPEDYNSLYE